MPIVNRLADLQPDIQAWRSNIHESPELLYDEHRTASFAADRLREFGCDEVVAGLAQTGVVGVIKGKKGAATGDLKTIGLRADKDALPIEEQTNLPYPWRPNRLVRDLHRPNHGSDRRGRHQDQRPRRPCRAPAPLHRFCCGRRAADHRSAIDRLAQCRSAEFRCDLDLRTPRGQRP